MEFEIANHTTFGQLGIIVLDSCKELGKQVDENILKQRRESLYTGKAYSMLPESFIVPANEIRFSNGEGKVRLEETVRGKDIYILCDVGNYSCTYEMYGYTNHKGPDEHFQDIKRTLSAIGGKSRRTTVVMPLLYASRQDKRRGRESLDCAMALQELERMGVKLILSFDVHSASVQNAIPLTSFENLYPSYEIVKAILEEEDMRISKDTMVIVSPDTGGMDRAIYYSSVLGLDVGLFYKRRDHTLMVRGKNPIINHEYIGHSIEGLDVLIVDDMIASGESIFDIVMEAKRRKARNVYVSATFALFTEGIQKFDEFYEKGLIKKVYSTNLTYIPKEAQNREWFKEVNLSDFIAKLINYLNYDMSINPLLDATEEIKALVQKHR